MRKEYTKDYYKILGVDRNATQQEIRASFRKLVKRYHPDVSKEPNCEEKVEEILDAYKVLINPRLRKEYDEEFFYPKKGREEMFDLENELTKYPDSFDINFRYAEFLEGKNKMREAEYYYRKAVRIQPNNSQAHYKLGCCLLHLNNIREGERHLITAINMSPTNTLYNLTYGIHLCSQKRPYEAEKYLEVAIGNEPESSAPNLWYGYCMYLQHRECEKYLYKAIYLDPTSSDANKFLGLYNLERGNIKEAERYLRIALFLSPTDEQVRQNLETCVTLKAHSRVGKVAEEPKPFLEIIEIEYNRYWAMRIELDYGDTLIAKMNVITDDKLDVLLVDENNFKKYISGEGFVSYRSGTEISVKSKVIVFTAHISSVYYFVLDNTYMPAGGAIPKSGNVKVQVYVKKL